MFKAICNGKIRACIFHLTPKPASSQIRKPLVLIILDVRKKNLFLVYT
jgi:hypothetical protein